MAETERAASGSGKSSDVFEFREKDELTENATRKAATEFGHNHVLDHKDTVLGLVSGTEIHSKENGAVVCGSVDAAEIDYNHDISGSFIQPEDEDFVKEKMPELNNFQPNDLNSHERATETKSSIIESGNYFPAEECGSGRAATVCLEDNSVHLASDADESMNERSMDAIANYNAFPDGQSSNNCFSDWNLGDDMIGILFHPDYIDYCGTHYFDAVVSFSQNSVVAKSKTIGAERTFQINLFIEDIIKIESQWSARCESGSVIVYFISRDVAEKDDIACDHSGSGIQELKFPAVDPNWYRKQEAIELLDVRYKALWNVLLDTGMEQFSSLPEVNALMLPRSYFPNFDTPFEEVIYPKGDPDAVSMSKRDVDLLLPDTFVNDTIIDFYIKYLRTRQNAEDRTKFHFFNCFFFRKLADMDKDPSSSFDGKAAFLRVRKWTRKVNLLEKDFIFIPVNYNYHWSLIIICYFGEIARNEDVADENSVRVPCVLHLDSLRGNHEGLKDLIQSYLWEEWKERQKEACEDLYSKFRNLKFATLELPQQQNTSDCGLFLLHYIELFLEEVPTNFNIYKISSSSKFLQADWFPPGEASMKRTHIERLISGLLDNESELCPPSCSNPQKTTCGYENEVGVSGTGLLRDRNLHSVCQVGQEMGNQCSKASGVFVNELLDKGLATEPFSDAPWGDLEHRASFHEFKRSVSLTEDVVATESFVQANLAEPALQHVDGGTPVFTFSSEDFKLHTVHQATLEEDADSPVTSDCDSETMLDFGESRGQNDDSFFFRQLQGSGECLADSPPATDHADKLDVVECDSLNGLETSKDHPHTPCLEGSHLTPHQGDGVLPRVDHSSPLESSDEQHPAKRIRTSSPDVVEGLASNLAEEQ